MAQVKILNGLISAALSVLSSSKHWLAKKAISHPPTFNSFRHWITAEHDNRLLHTIGQNTVVSHESWRFSSPSREAEMTLYSLVVHFWGCIKACRCFSVGQQKWNLVFFVLAYDIMFMGRNHDGSLASHGARVLTCEHLQVVMRVKLLNSSTGCPVTVRESRQLGLLHRHKGSDWPCWREIKHDVLQLCHRQMCGEFRRWKR